MGRPNLSCEAKFSDAKKEGQRKIVSPAHVTTTMTPNIMIDAITHG